MDDSWCLFVCFVATCKRPKWRLNEWKLNKFAWIHLNQHTNTFSFCAPNFNLMMLITFAPASEKRISVQFQCKIQCNFNAISMHFSSHKVNAISGQCFLRKNMYLLPWDIGYWLSSFDCNCVITTTTYTQFDFPFLFIITYFFMM